MNLRRAPVIAALAAGLLLVLLGVAQLVLPGLAASRVRSRLQRDGAVTSVRVSAFPAVELLWGDADSVRVHFSSAHVSAARTGELLASSRGAHDADVSIDRLREGLVMLAHVQMRKRGTQLSGQAQVTRAAIAAALPPGFDVQPVASGGGSLLLRAQVSVLGFGVGVDALLSAVDGALVVAPVGVPFGSLARLNVFADPHVAVESVGAAPSSDGYLLTASGRLL